MRVTHARPSTAATVATLVLELCEVAALLSESINPLAAVVLDGGDEFFLESTMDPASLDAIADANWRAATAAIAGVDAPTIALIRGRAWGPAWELALACDLRVARDDALLGNPEVACGRMPQAGGTQRLSRIVGMPKALDLLLTGRLLSGREALAFGVVHRAEATDAGLRSTVDGLIASLRSAAPIALGYAKEAVRGAELPLADGLRLEADLTSILQTTRDRTEGLAAFREKRSPSFTGG